MLTLESALKQLASVGTVDVVVCTSVLNALCPNTVGAKGGVLGWGWLHDGMRYEFTVVKPGTNERVAVHTAPGRAISSTWMNFDVLSYLRPNYAEYEQEKAAATAAANNAAVTTTTSTGSSTRTHNTGTRKKGGFTAFSMSAQSIASDEEFIIFPTAVCTIPSFHFPSSHRICSDFVLRVVSTLTFIVGCNSTPIAIANQPSNRSPAIIWRVRNSKRHARSCAYGTDSVAVDVWYRYR